MSDFTMDWARRARTGGCEAVLCEPKSVAQIEAIVRHAQEQCQRLLLTRLTDAQQRALPDDLRSLLDYDPVSRTAIFGAPLAPAHAGRVAIVAGGTSDAPVAREAARTLAFEGEEATLLLDVGVAGLWRLTERLEHIRTHRVVIAVAGMEGAIFSVLTGLVAAPVLAVPVSVGYGVGAGGQVALNAALASCASGMTVLNIDNGFGAAQAALRILNAMWLAARPPLPT
ncbi:MAG: nickel pincer cofactor biosynthesis protein LarB [Burkholderiales bacterium]